MYRIAHFSDFHLTAVDSKFDKMLNLIDDAIAAKADHLVISGDLVESQQMDVIENFMTRLAMRGWATPEKLTVIPGNHDLYPGDPRKNLKWPMMLETAYRRFCSITRQGCLGKRNGAFFHDFQIPFGKTLASDVVLAGLDTVHSGGILNLRYWASGELQKKDIDAAREFFDKQPKARHKILVIHHYPFAWKMTGMENFEVNFVDPAPVIARDWLQCTGTTLILCGHIHRTETQMLEKKCRLVCSGDTGDAGVYQLISLHANGHVKINQHR